MKNATATPSIAALIAANSSLSTEEFIALVGQTPRRVRNLVDQGALPTVVEGERRRFPMPAALHAFIRHLERSDPLNAIDAANLRRLTAEAEMAELKLEVERGALAELERSVDGVFVTVLGGDNLSPIDRMKALAGALQAAHARGRIDLADDVVPALRDDIENVQQELLDYARKLNTPEISDFAKGVVLEAAHQREKWDDETKRDFDWAAVAHWLLAKALINPPQNDGTIGEKARLHRLVALGALVANWHAAVLARGEGCEK
jgi:hypothetical protein